MKDHKIDNTGIRFHTPQANEDAEKYSRTSDINATAETLIMNFAGHKGSGEKAYIEVDGKKMKLKDVSAWINALDKDKDGLVSKKEIDDGGGDVHNILKLNADKNIQEKISKQMRNEQLLGGVKVVKKGLDTSGPAWWIAKSFIIRNVDKKIVTDMLKKTVIKDYISSEIIDSGNGKDKKNCRKHFKEVLDDLEISDKELLKLGFSEEQIKKLD